MDPQKEIDKKLLRYSNPVITGFTPDPTICRAGSDYFLAASSLGYFPGIPVYHSRDLIHWKLINYALTKKSQLDLSQSPINGGVFAPTLRYWNGSFYIVSTVVGGKGNFLVTARDPAGEWSDPEWLDREDFDPSLFFDDNGDAYYCRRDFKMGGIVQGRIDVSEGKLLTELNLISRGFCSWDTEAPHLYKYQGFYYLLTAEGGTRYGHMASIGRSLKPDGPFTACPFNPILTHRHVSFSHVRHTGHGDLVKDHHGNWWMVFLASRHFGYDDCHLLGRETFLAPVEWDDEGWPRVNCNGTVSTRMQVKRSVTDDDEKLSPADNFWEKGEIQEDLSKPWSLEWNYIGNPDPGYIRRTDRGCKMTPGPGFMEKASPSFIGRRQRHIIFTFTAVMNFSPRQEKNEAGIVVLSREENRYELAAARKEGKLVLMLKKQCWDISEQQVVTELSEDNVTLGVRGNEKEYRFFFADSEGREIEAGFGSAKLMSQEAASGFTGACIGLFARGNAGSDCAYFRQCSYSGKNLPVERIFPYADPAAGSS
jgi:xylan 1,4-beta-xylosidase